MADGFEYEIGGRHKMANPIDLQKLKEEGSITFEIPDCADPFGENDLEKGKEENMEEMKNIFKDINLKNMPLMCFAAEDALDNFDHMMSTWKNIHDGVYKKIIRPGKDDKVPGGAKVSIHFVAYHEYNDEPFDNSVKLSRPRSFRLGEGEVIPGLDIAVASMELKEISKFLILHDYAFGALGCPDKIPPNARVLFTIELLEYNIVSETANIFDMTPEERLELPFAEIQKHVEELKRDGKQEWENKEYEDAVSLYSKAVRILEEYYAPLTNDNNVKKEEILYSLYNNLAICHLTLNRPKKAIRASEEALKVPINVKKNKPYYRMCKAHFLMGNMEEAKKMGDEALRICPNDAETLDLYSRIVKNLHVEKAEEKELFQKMMNFNLA